MDKEAFYEIYDRVAFNYGNGLEVGSDEKNYEQRYIAWQKVVHFMNRMKPRRNSRWKFILLFAETMEVDFQLQIGQFLDQSKMQMRFWRIVENIFKIWSRFWAFSTLSQSRALSLTRAQICHSALESCIICVYTSCLCALDGPADKSARRVVQHTQRTISQLGRARTLVCKAQAVVVFLCTRDCWTPPLRHNYYLSLIWQQLKCSPRT